MDRQDHHGGAEPDAGRRRGDRRQHQRRHRHAAPPVEVMFADPGRVHAERLGEDRLVADLRHEGFRGPGIAGITVVAQREIAEFHSSNLRPQAGSWYRRGGRCKMPQGNPGEAMGEGGMTQSDDARPPVAVGHVRMDVNDLHSACDLLERLGLRPVTRHDNFAVLELRGGTHLIVRAGNNEIEPGRIAPIDLDGRRRRGDARALPRNGARPVGDHFRVDPQLVHHPVYRRLQAQDHVFAYLRPAGLKPRGPAKGIAAMTRIPALTRDEMDEEQKRVHDDTVAQTGRVGRGPAVGYAYAAWNVGDQQQRDRLFREPLLADPAPAPPGRLARRAALERPVPVGGAGADGAGIRARPRRRRCGERARTAPLRQPRGRGGPRCGAGVAGDRHARRRRIRGRRRDPRLSPPRRPGRRNRPFLQDRDDGQRGRRRAPPPNGRPIWRGRAAGP